MKKKANSFSSKQFKRLFLFIYLFMLKINVKEKKTGSNSNDILPISLMLSSREFQNFKFDMCFSSNMSAAIKE